MAELASRVPDLQDGIRNDSPLNNSVHGYAALAKTDAEGRNTIILAVEGAHCATCIGKIESRLKKEPDVEKARLNFTTQRLNIEWKGELDRANDFAKAVNSLGYKTYPYNHLSNPSENQQEEKFLLLCLGVAGFALGNIMMLSIGLWATNHKTMGIETRDFMHWMSALIAIPTILFSGRPFFRSAFRALSTGTSNMDIPISVALILTSGMSVFETMNHSEHAYFDSVVMLVFFLLIGRYLDYRARRRARNEAGALLGSVSGFANVIGEDGIMRQLPVSALQPGMALRIAAGEKISADGVIIDGHTTIDMALVTGETLPCEATTGTHVYTGTINISAPFTMQVIKAADDTLLSDILRLMEQAEQSQARYVRIADRMARLYTPVVHVLAAAAFFGWLASGMAWQPALLIAATVLIITCPCALALAVPVVQVLATARLMRSGILVKSGDALERLAAIDTILLDKTGTLTLGKPVLDIDSVPDAQILQIAVSVASYSSHPLSRALREAYEGPLLSLTNVKEYPGNGIEARYDGKYIRIGRREWCGIANISSTEKMEIWFSISGWQPMVFYFDDVLRADSKITLDGLKKHGLEIVLISGDRENAVFDMARQAGIDKCYAQMTPVDKYQILEDLRAAGKNVLMAGDGLNDAPVLAGANVSISPASASDLAQNAADIVFMNDSLKPLLISYETAKFSQRLVRQNFMLAIGYNLFAIPLAMAGYVTPLAAALAMSGSSLVVIANSFRLRRKIS